MKTINEQKKDLLSEMYLKKIELDRKALMERVPHKQEIAKEAARMYAEAIHDVTMFFLKEGNKKPAIESFN